eukprot:g47653.t1
MMGFLLSLLAPAWAATTMDSVCGSWATEIGSCYQRYCSAKNYRYQQFQFLQNADIVSSHYFNDVDTTHAYSASQTLWMDESCGYSGSVRLNVTQFGEVTFNGANSLNYQWTSAVFAPTRWLIYVAKQSTFKWPEGVCADVITYLNENCRCGRNWTYGYSRELVPAKCQGTCPIFENLKLYGNVYQPQRNTLQVSNLYSTFQTSTVDFNADAYLMKTSQIGCSDASDGDLPKDKMDDIKGYTTISPRWRSSTAPEPEATTSTFAPEPEATTSTFAPEPEATTAAKVETTTEVRKQETTTEAETTTSAGKDYNGKDNEEGQTAEDQGSATDAEEQARESQANSDEQGSGTDAENQARETQADAEDGMDDMEDDDMGNDDGMNDNNNNDGMNNNNNNNDGMNNNNNDGMNNNNDGMNNDGMNDGMNQYKMSLGSKNKLPLRNTNRWATIF